MKVIMFSDNKVWSIGDKQGAPSFYNTLKMFNDKGDKIFLIQPDNVVMKLDLENIETISFKASKFVKFMHKRKIGYFAKLIVSAYNKRQYKKIAKQLMIKERIDLFYAYEINGVNAAYELSKSNKMPYVSRFQGTILCDIKLNLLNRIRFAPHVSALSKKADLCIMTNDGTKGLEVLTKLNNQTKEILFLRNGVETTDFEINDVENLREKFQINDEVVFLTLSRLVKWKRLDRAISIMEKLIKQFNINAKLLILGEGEDKPAYEQLVQSMGLQDHIYFCGKVGRHEVANYMHSSDVFLSMYDLSNLGNPLFEAMSYGKIIVTLNNGDTKTVVAHNENGLIFDLENFDDIPNEIVKLLKDAERIERIKYNALKYAKENFYTWTERMEIEYTSLQNLLKNFKENNN